MLICRFSLCLSVKIHYQLVVLSTIELILKLYHGWALALFHPIHRLYLCVSTTISSSITVNQSNSIANEM